MGFLHNLLFGSTTDFNDISMQSTNCKIKKLICNDWVAQLK